MKVRKKAKYLISINSMNKSHVLRGVTFPIDAKNKLSYSQGNVSYKFILRGRLKEEIKTQTVS